MAQEVSPVLFDLAASDIQLNFEPNTQAMQQLLVASFDQHISECFFSFFAGWVE